MDDFTDETTLDPAVRGPAVAAPAAESGDPAHDQKQESAGVEADDAVPGSEPRYERKWSKRSNAAAPIPEVANAAGGPELTAQLEKEKNRADELFERLQRSMADLSNYRKRSESEREDMAKFANMLLISELLPVLDNFERALATIPRELEQFTWLQGVALIERHLRALLEREGLQPIEAAGTPFNPSFHDAIVEEESADAAPGTVIGEMQKGYTMHGRVIRPTLAKVSKAPVVEVSSTDEPAATTVEAEQAEPVANAEVGSMETNGS